MQKELREEVHPSDFDSGPTRKHVSRDATCARQQDVAFFMC